MFIVDSYKVVAGCLIMWVFSACADARQNETEWRPVTPGPLSTFSAPLCGKKNFVIQPLFFYTTTTENFDSGGKLTKQDGQKGQVNNQLFLQYGISEHVELDAQLSYIYNYLDSQGAKLNASGLGDSLLIVRYCPKEETLYFPHLTGLFQLKLPTGKYEMGQANKAGADLLGTGSTDFTMGINLSKRLRPFIFHSDLFLNIPTSVNVDGIKTQYGNYLNYNVALEWVFTKSFNLMAELNALEQEEKKEDDLIIYDTSARNMISTFGIGWNLKQVQCLISYQKSLYGRNVDFIDAIAFTIVYNL